MLLLYDVASVESRVRAMRVTALSTIKIAIIPVACSPRADATLLPDQMLSSRAKFIVQADDERVQIHSTRVIFSQAISRVVEQPRVSDRLPTWSGVGEARNAVSISVVERAAIRLK
jgi:hypothetical protein